MSEPSKAQKNIIKFIEDILDIPFTGSTSREAFKFIEKHKANAEALYKTFNHHGKGVARISPEDRARFIRGKDMEKYFEEHPEFTADMYGVPNH